MTTPEPQEEQSTEVFEDITISTADLDFSEIERLLVFAKASGIELNLYANLDAVKMNQLDIILSELYHERGRKQ